MKFSGLVLRWFAFFWIALLSISVVQYLNFKPDTGFLQLKQRAVQTGWYLPAFYCHIFGSSLILLAGFFQFSKTVYKNRKLHRNLGKFYVFGVLFFAAPGAFIMTLFINRGAGVLLSFFIQNSLWVTFTLSAWLMARKRNITGHVRMMRLSYALAFAAVTLRFYIWLCHVFGHGVDFQYNYLIIAFLSWVPNLLIAESINRNDKHRFVNKLTKNLI